MMAPIDVVIVECHHHALEHIHHVIRKKKYFKPWSMLHFDAHPDLACPTVPAAACFTPRHPHTVGNDGEEKNLYELLDLTSSGIAEWILPLVLAANLSSVEWIKPTFSQQLPLGVHKFQVGVFDPKKAPSDIHNFLDLSPTAQLKVDWNHSYYCEDGSAVNSADLSLAQTLRLHVSDLDKGESLQVLDEGDSPLWILDICLDYFACLNPYLTDIDDVDPAITAALLKVMTQAKCFKGRDGQIESSKEHDIILGFRRFLQDTLVQETCTWTDPALLEMLEKYYDPVDEGIASLGQLKRLIEAQPTALELVHDALPYWDMPHAMQSVSNEHVKESLEKVERALVQLRDRQPFMVTIARSTDDGFTPTSVVEELQEGVANVLHRVFCGSSSTNHECYLRFVCDYGSSEGCTIP